jgi:hypothetical protein
MVGTTRKCGTCSLCCKLPYVWELKKSIDTWCRHCWPARGGCTIYAERPLSCREFVCDWLSGHADDAWFPDRCKMVLEQINKDHFLVTVDPAFPEAWRQEPYYTSLRTYAGQGLFAELRIGRRFIGLTADGSEQEAYRSQAHIEGRP